jgi:lipopolysaccharide transport system ATP-binding protein
MRSLRQGSQDAQSMDGQCSIGYRDSQSNIPMSDSAVRVENLSKRYAIGEREPYRALRDVLARAISAPLRRFRNVPSTSRSRHPGYIWALKDVSFEVQRGEVVGIIGPNGAGKTTLLKILSRITEPTEGYAEIHGRVGSLLEVGTGFHPELTGRENIYLNGAILGMRRGEIERSFDQIVDFSGVEPFIDTPVKRYSSGMFVRLAFAVAAHLEPEILLVDEVLAVGDAAFQQKCLGKMGRVAKEGRTVLFVSHNMGAVRALCSRGIVLQDGTVRFVGFTSEAITAYLSSMEGDFQVDLGRRRGHEPSGPAWYTGLRFSSVIGESVTTAVSGQQLDIVLTYRARRPGIQLDFAIGIYNAMGEKILHLGTLYSTRHRSVMPGAGEVICRFLKLPLPQGRYRINVSLHSAGNRIDHIIGAGVLDVQCGDFYGTGRVPAAGASKVLVDHEWQLPSSGSGQTLQSDGLT